MVTSAKGAEQYYTIGKHLFNQIFSLLILLFLSEHHTTRLEGLEEARERDTKAAEAWIGKFWT